MDCTLKSSGKKPAFGDQIEQNRQARYQAFGQPNYVSNVHMMDQDDEDNELDIKDVDRSLM